MANTRYDLTQPKERKDGKVYWHKIGSMFSNEKGGFDITLDSLPVSDYHPEYGNRVRVKAFPSTKNDGQRSNNLNAQQQSKQPVADEFDDDVPF